jgi:hypothetical protein
MRRDRRNDPYVMGGPNAFEESARADRKAERFHSFEQPARALRMQRRMWHIQQLGLPAEPARSGEECLHLHERAAAVPRVLPDDSEVDHRSTAIM